MLPDKQIVALLFALVLLGERPLAWGEDGSSEGSYGAAAAVGTVLYTPLKAGLCFIGGTASALVFLSSGPRAARTVAGAVCGGTWVLTGEALEGKKPLNFVGESVRFPGD